MTYPALILRQSIAKQLAGECRFVPGQDRIHALDGESPSDCSTCDARCSDGAYGTSLLGGELGIIASIRDHDVLLKWRCPLCGCETQEATFLLESLSVSREIEADPCCHRCRPTTAAHE